MEKIKKIKIITLGASGVGKTSIINRIVRNEFNANQITTVGIEKNSIERTYKKKNLIMNLTFVDTAGQERFQYSLPKSYIRESHIVLLVFDSLETLEVIKVSLI